MNVLITGGTGFIGSHLVARLAKSGAQVTVATRAGSDLRRLRAGAADDFAKIALKPVDLTSEYEVARLVEATNPEVVFHLAGIARSRPTADESAAMSRLHEGAARALSVALGRARGTRLIALSTSDVYGDAPSPHDPRGTLSPRTAYGRTKARADEILLAANRREHLEVIVLRPYVVYGPRQVAPQLIPSLLTACREASSFQIAGGAQRRDFLFVRDVVDALWAAATTEGAIGEAVDLCSGEPTPVAEVARQIVSAFGLPPGFLVMGPRREDEPLDHFGDPEPAAKLLGWRAATDLATGIEETVRSARQKTEGAIE